MRLPELVALVQSKLKRSLKADIAPGIVDRSILVSLIADGVPALYRIKQVKPYISLKGCNKLFLKDGIALI